jgi:hypothetical protein
MSRLIESWKKSGWEYYFYDDDTAGEFLSTHFPPEVREAYESIIPGEWTAFKNLNEKILVLHVVANYLFIPQVHSKPISSGTAYC